MGHQHVVHCQKAPYDVYIGRPNPRVPAQAGACVWGNPFVIGKDGNRQAVIDKYRAFLLQDQGLVQRAKSELRGKTLACWCAPAACHGDVLAEVANE